MPHFVIFSRAGRKHHEVSAAFWKCHLDSRQQWDDAWGERAERTGGGEQGGRKWRRRPRFNQAECVGQLECVEDVSDALKKPTKKQKNSWDFSFDLLLPGYFVSVCRVCRLSLQLLGRRVKKMLVLALAAKHFHEICLLIHIGKRVRQAWKMLRSWRQTSGSSVHPRPKWPPIVIMTFVF